MLSNKVEKESFVKSFLLFFLSLGSLITVLFYLNYTKNIQTLDEKIFSQMRICSYNLKCKQFEIDFIKKKKQEQYKLYKNQDKLSSFYPIPGSTKNIMSITLDPFQYIKQLKQLKQSLYYYYFITLFIVLLLSIVFSFYALYPLNNALILTKEFIKDILHDFNTPLSSIRLNISMLKKEIGKNNKLLRVEQSVENILNLQGQLRYYLNNYTTQIELFDLSESIQKHIVILEKNYPKIKFIIKVEKIYLNTNKQAFYRIVDNILTNSAKYNKQNGTVTISFNKVKNILSIEDSGIGIKNTHKIFNRFYKEQERGIGIGLHIVKKLCDELDINISVKSKLGIGTVFYLDISQLTDH
jgi:signal transduction histidine kinase